MKWVATLHTSEQYTEDRWKGVTRNFLITDNTKTAELLAWYRSHIPTGPIHFLVSELEMNTVSELNADLQNTLEWYVSRVKDILRYTAAGNANAIEATFTELKLDNGARAAKVLPQAPGTPTDDLPF